MGMFARLAGIIGNFFQLGGPAGPGLNNNGGVVEARNAANSAYAIVRGATPLNDNDLVTKAYVDGIFRPIPVSLQFNGNAALPANTGTQQYYVVTTTGPNASIGDVLYDDGTGVGTVDKLPARTGNEIVTTTAFVGGTITLNANQNYVWTGSAWTSISPNVAGACYSIDMALTTGASQSSVASIPAGAIVLSCEVKITTPFSGGATITVGRTGALNLLQDTTDNVPTVAHEYMADQRTSWGASALPVVITVAGSPAAGAGYVTVQYSMPNA